ncbi:helix-turn-helix transcriptional regulator [Neobacillus sp. OS1-2]|uniref:helix-turn-helix domain-containing protein n=1 Tax=Neobacillus sp. OS1-2 TaxID=3070680 RepID=UPI0027E10767|nr:helix-turn-helix transcriptional regulator [Neobacillus sp. OS1-2]WML41998.1 helix-turn-helix transcriptional regulator [Neobacillus sp. OS1-2]
MSIGERFQSLRKSIGMKQVEFAKSIGISQGTLSDIEKGKYKPSIETIISTSEEFGVTTDWLLKGDVVKFEANEKFPITAKELVDRILYAINKEKNTILAEKKMPPNVLNRMISLIIMGLYNSKSTRDELILINIFRKLKNEEKNELLLLANNILGIMELKNDEIL